jgi:spore coat polysaccharide biosynthesis protein SpsF
MSDYKFKNSLGTVIGIQARTSSKRFPQKVLADISGTSMIEWVVNRCLLTGLQVFVLISHDNSDDELEKILKDKGINYFRGELNNVFSRYLEFINVKEGIEKIVRISADSPLIHPEIINKIVAKSESISEFDLVTNVYPRTFPKGQSVEVISSDALKSVSRSELTLSNQEHLTAYFYENPKKFKIYNVENDLNLSALNLSVDNSSDLRIIQEFVKIQDLKANLPTVPWQEFTKLLTASTLFL